MDPSVHGPSCHRDVTSAFPEVGEQDGSHESNIEICQFSKAPNPANKSESFVQSVDNNVELDCADISD